MKQQGKQIVFSNGTGWFRSPCANATPRSPKAMGRHRLTVRPLSDRSPAREAAMCDQSKRPLRFRFNIEMPSCFDEPMAFDLKDLSPAALEAIIDDLSEINPDDPRLPRLKESWDYLT
jgi:hypothetical protein